MVRKTFEERGQSMRIIIRFKSGFELPITCDNFSLTTHTVTGEITGYDIKGIEDNKPIFFRSEDVECVFRDLTATDRERGKA